MFASSSYFSFEEKLASLARFIAQPACWRIASCSDASPLISKPTKPLQKCWSTCWYTTAGTAEDSNWGNWVSPTSSFQALNTSESLSFLNVPNSFSSLISRMLQVLYFFTVSLHVSKAWTNADTKRSSVQFFSRVFFKMAFGICQVSFRSHYTARNPFKNCDDFLCIKSSRRLLNSRRLFIILYIRISIIKKNNTFQISILLASSRHVVIYIRVRNMGSPTHHTLIRGASLVSPPYLITALVQLIFHVSSHECTVTWTRI